MTAPARPIPELQTLSWLVNHPFINPGTCLSLRGGCEGVSMVTAGRDTGRHPLQVGSAHISWHLQHTGLVFSICFTLGRVSVHMWWSSVCSASCPGKAGVTQEEAAADGLDPAVPWWFGISGCGISAPIHHHFPRKGDVSCSGYILFRGGASDNGERKLNTEIGWTKPPPCSGSLVRA